MSIIGYGEDSLTYWALSTWLEDVLTQRGIAQVGKDGCLIFYRPSFGRQGGPESPQFGEFDSIISSPEKILLMESKWDGGVAMQFNRIVLKYHQRLRHRIFRWLWDHWARQHPASWTEFYEHHAGSFQREFGGKPLAPGGTLLAANLNHILNALAIHAPGRSRVVEDVLIYFHIAGTPAPEPPGGFELVHVEYQTLGDGGYFRMG